MRKFTQNLLLLTAASLFIFSCGEDEEPTFAAPSVSVSATVDGSPVTSGADVIAGSEIVFSVTVTAPGGVNGLTSGTQSFNRTELGADPGDTQGSITFQPQALGADLAGQTVSWDFQGVDDAGQLSETVTFTVNVTSPAVNSFTAILLGGFQNLTLGSFYDAMEDSVYTSSNALMNDEKIDLLFYYSDAAQYTIAALDNPEADATIEAQTTNGDLDNFDPQNPTRFKTFLTAPDFDAVSTVADLENAYAGDADLADQSRIPTLAVGDIFGFVLAEGRGEKIGLIEVVATTGSAGTDRAIEIAVKIEP